MSEIMFWIMFFSPLVMYVFVLSIAFICYGNVRDMWDDYCVGIIIVPIIILIIWFSLGYCYMKYYEPRTDDYKLEADRAFKLDSLRATRPCR